VVDTDLVSCSFDSATNFVNVLVQDIRAAHSYDLNDWWSQEYEARITNDGNTVSMS
jgi:hypothetical protein